MRIWLFRKKYWKYKTLSAPITKEVKKIEKVKKKLQKPIVQWVDNLDEEICKNWMQRWIWYKKNAEHVEFNTKLVNAFLNIQTLKMI